MISSLSYDPNTGHMFGFELGKYRYVGRSKNPPDVPFVSPSDQILDSLTGCYFLSGFQTPTVNIWSDGQSFVPVVSFVDGNISHAKAGPTVNVGSTDRILICGPIVSNPAAMSAFCYRYPFNRIYACPLLEELPSFGCLLQHGVKGKRLSFFDRNSEIKEGVEHLDFHDNMETDAWGRMADTVRSGVPVFNDICRGIGVSPFYGRFLHPNEGEVCVANIDMVIDLFPEVPISLKYYAATTVPVRVKMSEKINQCLSNPVESTDLSVSSSFIDGVHEFMMFYKVMCGRGFVFSSAKNRSDTPEKFALFRFNKAYVVNNE